MDKEKVQDIVIPLLAEYLAVQPVEADQDVDNVPEGVHLSFDFIVPYTADVGTPDRTHRSEDGKLYVVHDEDYKMTLSLTAIAPIKAVGGHAEAKRESLSLANRAADWFRFFGELDLMFEGIAILNITDIANRDSLNEDEYRNGFDVVFRVHKTLEKQIDYFDHVEYGQL